MAEAPKLDELTIYGEYLAVESKSGANPLGAGQGTVVGRGVEVVNYSKGPIIELGQEVVFREGTQIDLGFAFEVSREGYEVVFVAMSDVLALVKTSGEFPPA